MEGREGQVRFEARRHEMVCNGKELMGWNWVGWNEIGCNAVVWNGMQ